MLKKTLLILSLFVSVVLSTNAQSPEKHTNKDKRNRAIQGYDPVSYFEDIEPSKGKPSYSSKYQDAIYLFKSESNKALFDKSPSKYAPQYGGWCAYAMGVSAEKVEVNAESYIILDEKLYLFYKSFFNDTKSTWNEDEENLKIKADKNWHTIIN